MRAITASFLLEILCLSAFQSPIGLEWKSQPPLTNRVMETSLSISGLCQASGLIQMSFPQFADSPRLCAALRLPKASTGAANGDRMPGQVSRKRSLQVFQHLVGGE